MHALMSENHSKATKVIFITIYIKLILIYCVDLHSVEHHKINMIYRDAITPANKAVRLAAYKINPIDWTRFV